MRIRVTSPIPDRWEWSETADGWSAGAVSLAGEAIDLEVRRPDEIESPAWFTCRVYWEHRLVHLSEHHSARGAHETAEAAAARAWQVRNPCEMKDPRAST